MHCISKLTLSILTKFEQMPKPYMDGKRNKIAFNQISLSLIDCLREIMTHLTSTSSPHHDLVHFLQRAPLRCLPLVSQNHSDEKIKCVEKGETDCSVPNMCRRHRSVTASRRSIHQEDLFN